MPTAQSAHVAAPEARRSLERVTASALRRIGLDIASHDGDLVRELVPFVIDPESLHVIPPLDAVPERYLPSFDDIHYRNVALPPVPVLAPPFAHFLAHGARDSDTVVIDGRNVYGANLFGHAEGRRLLRRALGFIHEELARQGHEFDIIAYGSDAFLIVSRTRGGAPLRQQVQHIIARMTGDGLEADHARAVRDRLATFHRHATGDVLAPAAMSLQPIDGLPALLAERDIGASGTIEERFERLRSLYAPLAPLIGAATRRPPVERDIVLTLLEHRLFDRVLERLTDRLAAGGCPVRAFREPGELLAATRARSCTCLRLEVMSVLKAINEHPRGGYLAGNEVLRAIFVFLTSTVRRLLNDAGALPGHPSATCRRWADFYFCLDRAHVDAQTVCDTITSAFAQAKYVVIEYNAGPAIASCTASLHATAPPPDASRIVVPLIPVVSADVVMSEDLLSMPIDPPGQAKLSAIERRLSDPEVTDLDIAFLATWTLNARDTSRGIPRLVGWLGATPTDIVELSRHYEVDVDRKGGPAYRLKTDAAARHGVASKLLALAARARTHG